MPSGVDETDSDGDAYVHVRLTAFVIVGIAPRTAYVREVRVAPARAAYGLPRATTLPGGATTGVTRDGLARPTRLALPADPHR